MPGSDARRSLPLSHAAAASRYSPLGSPDGFVRSASPSVAQSQPSLVLPPPSSQSALSLTIPGMYALSTPSSFLRSRSPSPPTRTALATAARPPPPLPDFGAEALVPVSSGATVADTPLTSVPSFTATPPSRPNRSAPNLRGIRIVRKAAAATQRAAAKAPPVEHKTVAHPPAVLNTTSATTSAHDANSIRLSKAVRDASGSSTTAVEVINVDPAELDAAFGFSSFGTTSQHAVPGNATVGYSDARQARKLRQFVNRKKSSGPTTI
jgi:hypothetical protein